MFKRIALLTCLFFLLTLISRPASALVSVPVTEDTLAYSFAPTDDLSGEPTVLTEFATFPSFVPTAYVYLRFDLSGIAPPTSDLADGQLQLYVSGAPVNYGADGTPPGNLKLWRTDHDWNGAAAGIGDGTDISWSNMPGMLEELDVRVAPASTGAGTTFSFSSAALINYINTQRAAVLPADRHAAFVIEWELVPGASFSDNTIFVSQEGVAGTPGSFAPVFVETAPTAIQLGGLAINSSAIAAPLIATVLVGFVLTGLSALQAARRRRQVDGLDLNKSVPLNCQ